MNKEAPEYKGAFASGSWAAQEEGCSLHKNPYVDGSAGHKAWREGFLSYQKAVGDNRPLLQRIADKWAR